MKSSEQRIKQHLEEIAKYTSTPGQGTTRLSYSKQDLQTRIYLKEQMSKIGLKVREDAIGNIYGRLEGARPELPCVIIGSHFDSVPNGGMFDGPAGVVAGLEVATLFTEHKLVPYYPLEIIALVEEEGASFGAGLLASRTITGKVTAEDLKSLRDEQGLSAADRMASIGFNADEAANAIRTPESIKAFIELHIEQGPVLEQSGNDVGLVDVIVGISQHIVTITGKAGHAGTTPMTLRADALVIAAKAIAEIPQFALNAGESTVATVGKLHVYPNGANVIPSKVVFTVDIRSKDEEKLQQVIKQVYVCIESLQSENIKTAVESPLYIKPVNLSKEIHQLLQSSSDKLAIKHKTMVSGAGHDAMVFAGITEVGLIFVPSKNGLSHHPDEWTDYAQIKKGVDVAFATIKQLTKAQ